MHGSEFSHHNHIFREATVFLDEFRRVNEKEHEVQGPLQATIQFLWKKPPMSMFKIN